MELSPEERQKIYEEEKARIEARERLKKERQAPPKESTVDIAPNVAAMLCYVGFWITGLIFFIIEQKNNWIRFHAAQSLILFGSFTVFGSLVALLPYVGPVLSGITWFVGFVLWIILMFKAYNGERYKLAVFGDFAEQLVESSGSIPPAPESPITTPSPDTGSTTGGAPADTTSAVAGNSPASTPQAASAGATPVGPAVDHAHIEQSIDRKVKEYFERKQSGIIVGSAFAIAWSFILLVFFNFFWEYVAYYSSDTVNGEIVWTRYPFFTNDIHQWLPVLTTVLVLAIIGHIIIIIFHRPLVRNIIMFVLDIFGLAAVVSLLAIYPFDFEVIPNATAASITNIGVTVVLIGISIGIAVSLIVRFITTIIAIVKGTAPQT